MIISASRRTDIPAFYSQWFFQRLNQGFVLVKNPMNPQQVSRVTLDRAAIDCIVFWTKYPRDMMSHLDQLKGIPYYFLFTITPYGPELEKNLPPKNEVISTFIELSQEIGKERVVWRYDPIIITDSLDEAYHCRQFDALAGKLHPYTGRCIISFLDMYKKCERNLKGINIISLNPDDMVSLAGKLGQIAGKYNIEMVTCAEETNFSSAGIQPGKCIDDRLIRRIGGYPLAAEKDKHQRKTCGCVESIDIGAYNTCGHNCLYCYANSSRLAVRENMSRHNPGSPLLLGELSPGDRIVTRVCLSLRKTQPELF